MNKLSFAVAAVYGASKARAQACQPLPDQSITDKMELAELNYSYLDSCTQDGRVTKDEYDALIGDIGEGGADSAENDRKFQLMDLDNNSEISLVELLQHYRVKYYPVDLQGSLPPFTEVKDALYDYLRCRPKPSTDVDQECTATGYTKEDLKAVLPIMYALDNIIGDRVSYEAYADHEFKIRDTNYNGVVEPWEQNKYDWHYKFIRGFWNYSKGAGNVRETIEDDGVMTMAEWNQQDNMMLKRDYRNSDIPQEALDGRFRYFDRDSNGELSWWEYWSTIQEDDLQFYHFHRFFYSVDKANDGSDGDGDEKITRDELTAYYEGQGGMTDDEIAAKVEEFFLKYNNGEDDGTGDDNVGKWELWIKQHWEQHIIEYNHRRDLRYDLNFEVNVFGAIDDDGDKQWSYDEMLNHMSESDALKIYSEMGKTIDQELAYEDVKQYVMDIIPGYERTYGDYPIDYSTVDTSLEFYWSYMGVDSQAALDALFISMDLNSDGLFDYNEMCRHFVHNSDYFCAGERVAVNKAITQPDFKAATPFELFWGQFDEDHLNSDLSSVELENWQ